MNILSRLLIKKSRLSLWTTMEIEISSYCNRNCFWCPSTYDSTGLRKDYSGNKIKAKMPTEKVYDLIDQAANLGFKNIIRFHRLSEALWDDRYVDFARYAKNKGMLPCENTNCDPLKKNPELCAELDGVLCSITLGIYDYSCEKEKEEEIAYWKKVFKKTKVEFSLPRENCWLRQDIAEKYYSVKKDNKWLKEPCLMPSYYLPIRYDGEVMLCSEDDRCEFGLGNAFSKNLEQIWWSKKHAKVALSLKKPGRRERFQLCSNCYWGQVDERPVNDIL